MADSVNSVSGLEQYTLTKKVKQLKQELGKDEFLKIFLTQLQNQDPTSPMENVDSIAQMAQFSALEAMTNLANSYTVSQSYGMIGKGVIGTITDPVTGYAKQVIGTVDSAGVDNGKPYLMVGETRVPSENITQVFDNSIIAGEASNVMAGTAMVGKYARASRTVEGVAQFLEGVVERMSVREGKLYLTISGEEVPLNQIVTVAETAAALGQAE